MNFFINNFLSEFSYYKLGNASNTKWFVGASTYRSWTRLSWTRLSFVLPKLPYHMDVGWCAGLRKTNGGGIPNVEPKDARHCPKLGRCIPWLSTMQGLGFRIPKSLKTKTWRMYHITNRPYLLHAQKKIQITCRNNWFRIPHSQYHTR